MSVTGKTHECLRDKDHHIKVIH